MINVTKSDLPPQPGEGLYQRTVRSGFYVFALRITEQLFGIVRLIILARVLAPNDFGLMGIALLAMAALETFTQTGFQEALIQKKEDISAYLDIAWTIMLLRNALICVILFFVAPYIAIFFKAPAATGIIQVIGFSLLLGGSGGVGGFVNIGIIYFQKELEFNKQFLWRVSGTLADFTVSIAAALVLKSVWALVFGLLAGNLVRLIMSFFIHPYRPHFKLDLVKSRELFIFGKWILGSSILVFLVFQGDNIFVGKLLGVTLLAFYQMAYRFSNAPATEITHVISQVTFPAYSKLQDNLPSLRQAYLKTLQFTAFISIPLAGGIFILAPEFTQIFLTEKWMPIIPALQVLVLAGLLNSIGAIAGNVFQGIGKPQINTKWQLIRFFVLAASIYPLSIRWGILGTSVSVVLSLMVSTVAFSFMVVKITECGWKSFSKLIILPLTSAAIMVLSTFGLKAILGTVGIGQFILLVLAGISAYLSITYLLDRYFNYGMCSLIKESLSSLKGSYSEGVVKS
jgi:O-antigen/teichoic acid export membrane protein